MRVSEIYISLHSTKHSVAHHQTSRPTDRVINEFQTHKYRFYTPVRYVVHRREPGAGRACSRGRAPRSHAHGRHMLTIATLPILLLLVCAAVFVLPIAAQPVDVPTVLPRPRPLASDAL
jgi:hypothetical protein